MEGPHAEPVPEAQAVEEPVVAAYKGVMEPAVDYSYLPYAQNYEYYGAAVSAPVPVVDTTYSNVVSKPVVATVPVAPVAQAVVPAVQAVSTDGTQYHSQDDIGQYSFGYSNGESVKQEVKTADGVVRGAYQYVDANGSGALLFDIFIFLFSNILILQLFKQSTTLLMPWDSELEPLTFLSIMLKHPMLNLSKKPKQLRSQLLLLTKE